MILSSVDDPFFSEILQGIEDGVQGSGYSLFIAAANHDLDREQEIVQAMVEHRADGVIICSTTFSQDQAGNFLHFGVPIVVVNNQAAEDFRYSIYHDDTDGSRKITQHLIELGHQKIAYLGNALSGRTNQDRLSGFRSEMDAADLPIPEEYITEAPGGSPQDAEAVIDQLAVLPILPTALICFNDMLAIGALRKLGQLGINVPREMSVTGFDNIIFSGYTNPPLTTFDQPKRFIGTEAAELLLGLLDSAANQESVEQPQVTILKGELLVRQSTAPPPAKDR